MMISKATRLRGVKRLSRLDPWLPPVALMALIYLLSDQPNLNSGLGVIDLVARKVVHAGEFGLLCFLWWRALRRPLGVQRALAIALLVAVNELGHFDLNARRVRGEQQSLQLLGRALHMRADDDQSAGRSRRVLTQ